MGEAALRSQPSRREVPSEITDIVNAWQGQARRLRVIHVFLLIGASGFSILTASAVVGTYRDGAALTAALCVGIMTTLDLGVKANGMRNAWRHMNAAMARFRELPEERFGVEHLIQAYEAAEIMIGDLPSGPQPGLLRGHADQSRMTVSTQGLDAAPGRRVEDHLSHPELAR